MQTEVVIPYAPREAFKAFHARTERWAELICHRRAGKTVAAINDLQRRCLTLKLPAEQAVNPPRFAFMAPTRVRAKDIAWQYLKRFSEPIPGIKVSESELFVEYPHKGRVTVYGADNDRGMGLYLDGIVMDECDEIPPTVDAVVIPALADRKGWAVKMGILRGRHNLLKEFEKYRGNPAHYQMMLKASESGIIDREEMAIQKDKIGEAAYAMQFECDVSASLASAIYGTDMDAVRKEGRLRFMAADPESPLYTFWDIGHSDRGDDWSIWLIQFCARDIVLLDYYSRTGHPPAHYAVKTREWEDTYKNRVGCHFLPHDGSRHNQVGKSTGDYLRDAGLTNIKIVHRTPAVWDSINHLRGLFPRIFINSTKCGIAHTPEGALAGGGTLADIPSGVDCLDYYSKKEDASTGIIMDVPVHNQYSHGADALRTMAEADRTKMLEGMSSTARESRSKPVTVLRGPGPQSYSVKPKQPWAGRVLR